MCLIVRLWVDINDRKRFPLDMIIPFDVVDPIIAKLQEQQLLDFGRGPGGSQTAFERLEATPTELRASYPPVLLAAEEILFLTPGQVITLIEGTEPPPVQLVVGDTVIATASVERDEDPMICRILSLEV
jgi:flagellar motor switch protein FliM